MQKKVMNLDGSLKVITTAPSDPREMINQAVENSADSPAGFLVVIGENLEDSPSREIYHVIAANGVLVCQNVLNPE